MKSYHIVVLATALVLAGLFCLRPPAMPQWDTTLCVPLYRTTLRLVDFLDSARFKVQPDSTVFFAGDFPFDTISPAGVVDLLSSDEAERITLADFVLTGMAGTKARVGIEELLGTPVPESGAKRVIPAFERTFELRGELEDIAWAEIVGAKASVRVTNGTGLAFDSVVLVLPFGRTALWSLGARESRAAQFEIAGAYVQSPLSIGVAVGSAGTAGDTVRLEKTDSLAVEVGLDSVRLAGGRVRVPPVQGRRWCRLAARTSKPFKIDSLALAAGGCRIEIVNEFGIPIEAEVWIPKLGQRFRQRLDPHCANELELDLAGLAVDNRAKTNSLFDFEVMGAAERSGDYVDLGKSDGLAVVYETHSLRPARVAGTFVEPVYVAARLETLPKFLPTGLHGLRVPNAEVVLDLENSIGFPFELNLELAAVRDGQLLARMVRPLVVAAGEMGKPRPSEWVLPITELVNTGPDYITMSYTARVTGQGEYDETAWLTGRATMSTPMRFAFVPDTVPGPRRVVSVGQSHRDAAEKHFVSGRATVDIGNRFPIGFSGWLSLKPDSAAPADPKALVDELRLPFSVPAGRVDRLGNCVGESSREFVAEIDSVEATLFRRSPLDCQLFLELPASDTMNFRATDRLRLDVLLELDVRVER